MRSVERNQLIPDSDSDVASPTAGSSSRNIPLAGAPGPTGDAQQVPGLRLINCKSGGGWALGPSYAYLPSHEEQVRAKLSVTQTSVGERPESAAVLQGSAASRPQSNTALTSADRVEATSGEVAPSSMYIGPAQDLAEDDDKTFVDHGSTTLLFNTNTDEKSTGAVTSAVVVSSSSVKKTAVKPRTPVTSQVGSPTPCAVPITAGTSPTSAAAHTNGRGAALDSAIGDRSRDGPLPTPSLAQQPGGEAEAPTAPFSMHVSTVTSGGLGSSPPPSLVSPPPLPRLSVVSNAHTNNGTSATRRGNGTGANTNPSGGTAEALSGGAGLLPQYSRMNSSEAAPGVVYRAALPGSIRAMVMDPVEPVVWTAVGDDPLAALRLSGRELTHLKSMKDIEQVCCMAVVRIAEEQGTTFKSPSTSPRVSSAMLKPHKGGRRRKSARNGSGLRKSGKLRTTGSALLSRCLGSGGVGGEDDMLSHGNSEADNTYGDDVMLSGGLMGHDRQGGVSFSNYLWCGLSRGHMAVVNMSSLEYQLIHNAHSQTINKIWYWESGNKVWSAGRDKGVHVWDPQRRVVLKRRNIAAILTDATYAESCDKVFAVAGDACVRVFEPSGENVCVPKGQENRIRVKSDASVIQYHRNSGLLWVGLARGSVLMNASTLEVECTLPYTFSAILFEGNNAIMAGQEAPSGEGRLMVLDVADPRQPSVLAYSKFSCPLPLGLHVFPGTRFAVAAQDDPKKGCMMAVFVYDGTVTLKRAAPSGGAPPQRTEWVPRGTVSPTAVGVSSSPQQLTQAPDQPGSSSAITTVPTPPVVSNVNTHTVATAATVDRATLHRGAVVKTVPDYRTDRKLAVETDRSSLVEAIVPDAQDIKNALKHLVKTTDEVRQSLVHQRSAEATLADFSRVLRGRQQWLFEQGSLTSLPVLPSSVTDRIDTDYATAEGKTIATSIEQLQQMYTATLAKLEQALHSRDAAGVGVAVTGGGDESRAALSGLPVGSSSPREWQMPSTTHKKHLALESSAKDQQLEQLGRGLVGGEHHPPDMHFLGRERSPAEHSRRSDAPLCASGTEDSTRPSWGLQLATTLQRERALHTQQLNALQLQAERLAERNTALSAAFVRLQAHVAAVGQQKLASMIESESVDSTTVASDESPPSFSPSPSPSRRQPLQAKRVQQQIPSSSTRCRDAAALFAKLSHGQYHNPKHVRRSTDTLVKAIDEIVRLAQSRRGQSGDRDALGGTFAMAPSLLGPGGPGCIDEQDASANMDLLLTQRPLRQNGIPLSSSPPVVLALEPPLPLEESAHPQGGQSNAAAADDSALLHRPITSLPGVCSMAELELRNLTERNMEVASFWARLQCIASRPYVEHTSDHNIEQHATPTGSATDFTLNQVNTLEAGLLLNGPAAAATTTSRTVGTMPGLETQLMTARVFQAVCWAECVQTVLRELTHAEGIDNVFLAGCVHNTLISPRTTTAGGCGSGTGSGVRGQGPLKVLDYESAQEQSMVLARVSHLSTLAALELSNTSRVREGLRQQQCWGQSKEAASSAVVFTDSDFRLHRLPGALHWSLTALRLLFAFLSDAETRLLGDVKHSVGGDTSKVRDKQSPTAGKQKESSTTPSSSDDAAATRALSAVGVAMTHWAMFLVNLQADLTAVHHAARLYHAWFWGSVTLSAPAGATSLLPHRAGGAAHNRLGTAHEGGGGVSAHLESSTGTRGSASMTVPTARDSLASLATSLSSKGKLLLLYMQWHFPGFAMASTDRAAAPAGGVNGIPGSVKATSPLPLSSAASSLSITGLPTLFRAEEENDTATTTAAMTPCSAAESFRVLSDTVAQTEQLLHRVRLLLAYTHALRTRALTGLRKGQDELVTRAVASFASTAATDADARVPTEEERAFLES
ncbi:hypothetical protein JKF63_06249 [Porcisia hertigi]|uniref:Uncharacterized protein n=1 Tax=Porcisia hertigi TaxID=2761500 RepID=A0A836IHD0_9TRYP|nr:hypothetical protein JKF63_06249 [Porcisia hertigi]